MRLDTVFVARFALMKEKLSYNSLDRSFVMNWSIKLDETRSGRFETLHVSTYSRAMVAIPNILEIYVH